MILIIDNYDSFTYNLYQLVESLGYRCAVKRNDEISIEGIRQLSPGVIIISPGPGRPEEAGISLDVIRNFGGKIPIFGVCLGHQAIGQFFGAQVRQAGRPRHGKTSLVYHNRRGLYEDLPSPFTATRYHSLVVDRASLPSCMTTTCETKDGIVMGISHKSMKIEGVQFHPESIATQYGREIVKKFLKQSLQGA